VLSAGTIGSPTILIHSGVTVEGLAENLQDHVTAKLVFQTSDALKSEVAMPIANGIVATQDLHLLPVQDRFGERAHITVALLRPHSRGHVRLGKVEHNLLSDQRDRAALEDALALVRDLAEHETLRTLGCPLTTSIDETVGIYFHPVGTCAMGTVVDEAFRVRGFENLYVCDASVFETIPRANTHLPTLALAEKLGSQL
jgi:GMC oxidoreductase